MNSLALKENGFAEPVSLKGLTFSVPPHNKGIVLVLTDKTLSGKPTSDVLYIGRTKKPTKRIFGGYLAGYGGKTTKKINSKLLDDGYIEKVAISWITSENPKATQQELLEKFKKEHGDYPLWNVLKKNEKKPQSKPQQTTKVSKMPPASKPSKAAS